VPLSPPCRPACAIRGPSKQDIASSAPRCCFDALELIRTPGCRANRKLRLAVPLPGIGLGNVRMMANHLHASRVDAALSRSTC